MRKTDKKNARGRDETSVPVPGHVQRGFVMLVLVVAAVGIGWALVRNLADVGGAGVAKAAASAAMAEVPSVAAPMLTSRATPEPERIIGIVSGHRDNDSGTVCKDGLTENEVNFDHASRTAEILRAEGYTVDILGEKDPRLQGYKALVFLSIHADSCTYINDLATGYKVARSRHSALPEVEDRLVACVSSRYKKATGLRFHRNTVTANMLEYHGFYKIDAFTPSAIIETGFMSLDRDVLTKRAPDVARGIADGILCYVRNEEP